MKTADHPFRFFTASYLTRIGNLKATSLCELRGALEKCSDASIFYHTFQSLGRHHFLTEGFSNDFAQWILAALNCARLAEQMAVLDIRSYLALNDLRNDLVQILDEFCNSHPNDGRKTAFEPFYFCESMEVTVPLGWDAWTLQEFRQRLQQLSHASLHFHFLVSRLRLHLRTNDFSVWFGNQLGLESLAARTNRIDIYTSTLEGARAKLLNLIDRELVR